VSFQDHFSRQSEIYRLGRPTYPEELFKYLASIAPGRQQCWDCATGNGQAAISLSNYFDKVLATDASEKQIESAMPKEHIDYKVSTAEDSGLPTSSVDLITVATAAHWFNLDSFYAEAERVAKPNGILALWTYSEASISKEMDELMEWYMYDFLLSYWPDGRSYVRNKYKTLPFPFEQIETPTFLCKMIWTKEQWLNYVRSWSSYNNYVAKHKTEPLNLLTDKLDRIWNDSDTREITWQLHLKCARLNSALA
jgi:ubiquinone/menaquinone biosynthesis C-methylase UbiE